MIIIEEIPVERINEFWEIHINYLVDDGMISDEEDIAYFTGKEYRGILEDHMIRKMNSTKENSIRFWKSMGFVENGKDEYDMLLLVKR